MTEVYQHAQLGHFLKNKADVKKLADVVAHTFNPITQKTKAGGSVDPRTVRGT